MNPSDSRQPWDKVFGNVRQIRASSSGTLSPTWHGRSCEDAPTPRRMPYPVPCPGCSASGVPSSVGDVIVGRLHGPLSTSPLSRLQPPGQSRQALCFSGRGKLLSKTLHFPDNPLPKPEAPSSRCVLLHKRPADKDFHRSGLLWDKFRLPKRRDTLYPFFVFSSPCTAPPSRPSNARWLLSTAEPLLPEAIPWRARSRRSIDHADTALVRVPSSPVSYAHSVVRSPIRTEFQASGPEHRLSRTHRPSSASCDIHCDRPPVR